MKTWTMMAATLVLAMVVSAAYAAEGDKKVAKAKPVAGTITAVDDKSISVQPGDAAKPVVTVNLTDTTKVKVDGKEATIGDLKKGQKVRVVLDAEGKNAVSVTSGKMDGHGEGRK